MSAGISVPARDEVRSRLATIEGYPVYSRVYSGSKFQDGSHLYSLSIRNSSVAKYRVRVHKALVMNDSITIWSVFYILALSLPPFLSKVKDEPIHGIPSLSRLVSGENNNQLFLSSDWWIDGLNSILFDSITFEK